MQFVERGDWMDDSNQFQPEPDLLDPTSWEQAIALYGKMLYRVIRLHVKNKEDADDLYQETFSRLMGNRKPFSDETHRKAWLLRVALNLCKDFNKSTWQRRVVSLENSVSLSVEDEEDSGVMQAVMKLPEKMRIVVHLHYYEGYTVPKYPIVEPKREFHLFGFEPRATETEEVA
jgi:RNA polymerase sigma-70 factor (ECF subfamily)